MTIYELQQRMGADTSDAEAEAMSHIMTELDVALDDITDAEFFALIPKAIERARIPEVTK
jgi:hypothetical protein